MDEIWTIEALATQLEQDLIGYRIVRADDCLCIRDEVGAVAIVELEPGNSEHDRDTIAVLSFAEGVNPTAAALIAITLDEHIYTYIDSNLFNAYRVGTEERA